MRDQRPLPDDEDRPPEPEGPGHLRPTSAGLLTALGVAGLVIGWLLHPISEALRDTAPVVTWVQPVALLIVAAILGAVAWSTWRTVHVHQERLDPRRALNRLALARACAYVGALVAGGYAGFAVSWLGIDVDLARQRALRSAVAALVALIVVGIALLLERACRIRSDDSAS